MNIAADLLAERMADIERLTRERDDGRNEIADVPAAIAALREFMADPNVRTGAPVAEWTEREARLRRAIEREARAVRADRDRLAAALADLREAVTDYRTIDTEPEWERASDRLDAVLAATPADLATAHDARVRAETLRAAADLADRGSERGGWQDDAPLSGDVLPHEVADWLRAEADRIGGGR